jgi:hypothetical protein
MHIYHCGTLVEVAINLVTKRAYAYYCHTLGEVVRKTSIGSSYALQPPQLVDQLDACRILVDVRAE